MADDHKEYICYYTETDGKRENVRLEDVADKSLVRAEYQIYLSSSDAKKELRLNIPEKTEGCSVGSVRIHCSVDGRYYHIIEEAVPDISYIYLPSGVSFFCINISLKQDYIISYSLLPEHLSLLNRCIIEVSPDNPYFCVCEKGLYSKDMSELYYIFSPGEEFMVPSGVKLIKTEAAKGLKGLKKLVIPESVAEVGQGAFQACEDLEEAEIHAESIGRHAFRDCASLASLRLDCKEIDSSAFAGCSALRYAELLNTVPICGNEVFFLCGTHLTELKLPDDDPDYCIYKNALYSRDMTELYYILTPEEGCCTDGCFEIPSGVRMIRPFAGNDLTWLRRLVIPKGVIDIGTRAFLNCSSLEEADVHTIAVGDFAFAGCELLSSLKLDCKLIGSNAFSECKSLKTAELFNAEIIESRAFDSCHVLTELRLPDTLLRIKHDAFHSTKITHLRIPPSVIDLGYDILKNDSPTSITLELYLKDGALPVNHRLSPVPNGALIIVRSPEPDEILAEFVKLGGFDTIFTKNGIDFTEYDKIFNTDDRDTRFTDLKKFLAAKTRLHCPIGADEEKREFFKAYAAEKAELLLIREIKKPNAAASGLSELEYYEYITVDGMVRAIDESVNTGNTELTALLMQKLYERKSHD